MPTEWINNNKEALETYKAGFDQDTTTTKPYPTK